MRAPDTSPMRCPTAVEPVKLTMSTFSSVVSTSEGATSWLTTQLTTPGGNPASTRSSAMRMTPRGSCGAGFMMTVLPIARAGATLPAILTTGKLYDEIAVTTPTGARLAIAEITPPGANAVDGTLCGRSGVTGDSLAPSA